MQFLDVGMFAEALFRQESARTFSEGYVFKPSSQGTASARDRSDFGYWACDVMDNDRLAWSTRVCELFGLPAGSPVDREWAVSRYATHSRSTLQRVREFALRHTCSFILDAEIAPPGAPCQWIRVLAVPVFQNGRISRLHGLKRAL